MAPEAMSGGYTWRFTSASNGSAGTASSSAAESTCTPEKCQGTSPSPPGPYRPAMRRTAPPASTSTAA
ncbi:hypothetical protein PSR1_01597 [Anaeromyxobacter sp. PSR-1]|nr:hypothetical protein PSR1_01597 [Anaeromyxobacter sp. PSR-1]